MSDLVTLELEQHENFRFEVRFDHPGMAPLLTDEPPLGTNSGPNPSRLLVAAIANCLAASLLFAMRKLKNEPGPIHARATAAFERNQHDRLRVANVSVTLRLALARAEVRMADRILAQFEDFCVVTQSVRAAFPVRVEVLDRDGIVMKG